MKQWICSDSHFNHKNILKYEPKRLRQVVEYQLQLNKVNYDSDMFSEALLCAKETLNNQDSAEFNNLMAAHNSLLIKCWNEKVAKDDLVYFLGDFTLTRKKEAIKFFLDALNGRKILIMGNHDTRKPKEYVELGFEQATKRPIVVPRNKRNVFLMHEPPYDDELEYDYKEDENGNLIDSHDHVINNNVIRWNPFDVFLFGHVHSNIDPTEVAHNNVKCICLDRNDLYPFDMDYVINEICKNL